LCLGDDNTPASDRLKQFIAEQEQGVSIDDQATRGRLQKALFDIHTADKLDFKQGSKATFHIEGLAEIWQAEYDRDASLSFTHDGKTQTKSFPNRGQRSINYAVELICQLILDGVK